MLVLAFSDTRALNTVFDGTAPKKFFTVTLLETGVPLGSSTMSSRSGAAVVARVVSWVTFLSAILFSYSII
jgi:hypothetical protein